MFVSLFLFISCWLSGHGIAFSRPKRITDHMDRLVNTCLDELCSVASQETQSYLYKSHMNAVFNLIRSDVQNKSEFRTVSAYPVEYLDTIREIYSLTARLESLNHPMLPLIKVIIKKDGLPRDIGYLRDSQSPSRDIIEVKRKVERSFSMILLALLSYRTSKASSVDQDFIFFAKPLLELVPVQDRHFAFMLFCKGLFAPNYILRPESKDVQTFLRNPYPSILHAYKSSMESEGIPQVNVYGRLLYPIAVISLRCHSFLRKSEVFVDEKNCLSEDLRIMRFYSSCRRLEKQAQSNRSIVPCKVDEILFMVFRYSLRIYYLPRFMLTAVTGGFTKSFLYTLSRPTHILFPPPCPRRSGRTPWPWKCLARYQPGAKVGRKIGKITYFAWARSGGIWR